MRTDISAATTTLLESGAYDAHWLVQVANGSDTLIDVSGRVAGISGALPSGDAPIGTCHVEFLRDLNDDPSTSLAPLIASDFNVLDDGTTFSALLQVGRRFVASVALTARGGSRPVDADFDEVFRGRIRHVGWGGWYGGAAIDCLDQAGALQRTKSEAEYTYASGTAVETAMQAVLDNNGFSAITLSVPTATDAVIENEPGYQPGLQKSVWEQLQALASSIGWVCWYRYDDDGDAQLVLFEPDRTNVTSGFTFDHIYEVEKLEVDEEDIGNVLYDQYTDSDGARQLTDAVVDDDSIAKYGDIRRTFFISEEEGSPVTTDAQATALLTAILPDLADPNADASYRVPLFLFGECAVDVYTFPADDRHYDEDQTLAPFAIRWDHQAGQLPTSTVDVRGKPSGGSGKWRARRADPGSIPSEPEAVYALDLKEIGRAPDDSTATFDGAWGSKISEVRTYEALVAQPYSINSWPEITGDPTQGPFTSQVALVFDIPPQGYVRLVKVVGILEDGTPGAIERITILPTGTEPDLVTGLSVLVNDADGSASIRVDVADRAGSIRYAYAVGADPTWSTDAAVEAGTVVALTGSTSVSLAAGTVEYLETLRFRVCAYTGAAGTGYDGATDHGPIVGGEDIRLPTDVTLTQTTASESAGTGTFGATLHDASGICTKIEKFTRSGSGTWVGPTTITASPVDGTEYTATVTLEEDHQSQVKIRATYTKNGSTGYVECVSPGFDAGQIPNITITPVIDEVLRTASAAVSSDFDTASVKIAASTTATPSAATVRAATAINGRDLTPADISALVSSLTAGDTVYFAAYGYSEEDGGGNESTSLAVAQATVGVVAPMLEVSSESETSTTGTFAVILRDPSGVATDLYYRTKSGPSAWGSWTLKTGTPSNGTTYTETVSLVEDHLSFIEFRVDYSLLGLAKSLSLKSSGFDKGKIPDLSLVPRISETGAVSCEIQSDFDTASVKVAASTSAYPSDTTTRAATAIDGRIIAAATVGTLLTLNVGQTAYLKAFGYSAVSGGGTESSAAITATITRGAAYTPKVKADFTRSGTTATLAITDEDLLKRTTAIEWSSQAQGGTATSFSGTWSSSTGTAGTDATLTRSQTFTVSDGADLAVRYQVTFTDENGDSKIIADTLTVSNLAGVTKTIRIPYTALVPFREITKWNYQTDSLIPGSLNTETFRGAVVLPKGVTITSFACRMKRAGTSDSAQAILYKVADTPAAAPLATLTAASGGWATASAALSQLVGDETYTWELDLDANTTATDVAVMWAEFTYTVPTYAATY